MIPKDSSNIFNGSEETQGIMFIPLVVKILIIKIFFPKNLKVNLR